MDVVRLNFSHRSAEHAKPLVERVRCVADRLGVSVGILGDLRGPRIRIGEMQNGVITLKTGNKIILSPEPLIGTAERIAVSFRGLANDVAHGTVILLDDGNIELQVIEQLPRGEVLCEVLRGGELKSNKGVNLKNRLVSLPSLTTKDYQDLDFAVSEQLDFLALSFVQSASDVRFLKQALAERGANIPVIAKIERKNALEDIERIVKECYGVMVARGDLALEMSFEDVPIAQKQIISACRQAGVPVITATQMLESMTNFHKPTRAEAADVANAILDGTDAVMLSGESAVGKFPVEVVSTMAMERRASRLTGTIAKCRSRCRGGTGNGNDCKYRFRACNHYRYNIWDYSPASRLPPAKNADYRAVHLRGDMPSHEFDLGC